MSITSQPEALRTYQCFYESHQAEVKALTTYGAQKEYQRLFKVPEKKRYKISVYLVAQADGTPYKHTAVD